MTTASHKISLFLGRHAHPRSGLWVYNRNLVSGISALLNGADRSKPIDFELLVAGPEEVTNSLRDITHDLDWINVSSKARVGVWRRLGFVLDLFTDCGKPSLLHGTANFLPLKQNGKRVITVHDVFQAYPPLGITSIYEYLRSVWYGFTLRLMLRQANAIIAVSEKTKSEIQKTSRLL